MSDLKEMLDEFNSKYVYAQTDGYTTGVYTDKKLIYRILSEMTDRIENIERQINRVDIVENEK